MKKPSHKRPSAAEVRRLLSYDPETGVITHLAGRCRGNPAGYRRADGYVVVYVGGRQTYAHIVAWVLMRGKWPKAHEVDHQDLDRSNNRWANLRRASRSQQRQNQKVRRDSKSGIKGVIKRKRSWGAHIRVEGRAVWLGSFPTAEAAARAYQEAAEKHFGEYARAA